MLGTLTGRPAFPARRDRPWIPRSTSPRQWRSIRRFFEQAHLRAYARFTHLLRWFVFHALVDLIGIAAFVTGHPAAGATFIVLGTALLVWGILTTRAGCPGPGGERSNTVHEVAEDACFPAGSDVHKTAA